MKSPTSAVFIIAALITLAPPTAVFAAEPESRPAPPGIGFVPPDFYPKHREELGLSDEQMQAMKQTVEGMRERGEKIQAELRDRSQALQTEIGKTPVDPEKAMERFRAMLQAENEMKGLQFGTQLALRKVLRPEQEEKIRDLVKNGGPSPEGSAARELREKLQKVRQEIARRSGGNIPREGVEMLERIEQNVRQGNTVEAKGQLENLLRNLEGREAGGPQPQPDLSRQLAKLQEALKNTNERLERMEQKMQKSPAPQGDVEKRREGGPQKEGAAMEKQVRRMAEAAERTDDPQKREKLQGAINQLREAASAGNREAVEKILRSVEPLLQNPNH